ncbi:MAG: thioredoxin [Nanoarchaeota archaeon]|nr:thioredoxin [Nanoarchaeota archaeon]
MAFKTIAALAFASVFYTADTSNVEEITPETFNENVIENNLPAVVEFYSETCAPCRHMRTLFEKVCKELEGQVYCAAYKVEQDDNARRGPSFTYNARDVPQFGFFCRGVPDRELWLDRGTAESILRMKMEDLIYECR